MSSEEKISSHTTEVPKNTNKRITEALDISIHDRKEVETDEKSANDVENVQFSKIVKLNVGGHFFSTSLETLTNDSGSMLHAMFAGRFNTKPSEDGSYFIDRDGTHFRYILNYLRTGQLIVPADEIIRIREELLAEAEFYQVEGLIKELTARPFKESEILSSDQCQTLMKWLKNTQALTTSSLSPVLLYSASRDGWTGAKFHSCCNNKGPTVAMIESYEGSDLFGVYIEKEWEDSSEFYGSTKLILFSIDKKTSEQEQFAVSPDFTRYGPVYRYGFDYVSVKAPNNSNNCSVTLNGRTMTVFQKIVRKTIDRRRPNRPQKPEEPIIFISDFEVFGFE